MSDPTLRPLFYTSTEPGFQDWGDCGEDREEKVEERLENWNPVKRGKPCETGQVMEYRLTADGRWELDSR